MELQNILISQFSAALHMLRQCLERCPESLWDDPADKNKFWHNAYHALFYTYLYLHPSAAEFTAWPNHRENYHNLGDRLPWPPHDPVVIGAAYTKAEVLEFWQRCAQMVGESFAKVDLQAEQSGFDWIPLSKLELQLYNLRHLQQHTGELMERLSSRAGVDVEWVGSKAEQEP
jgi:hypothetical protein